MIINIPFLRKNISIKQIGKPLIGRQSVINERHTYNKVFVIGYGKTGTTTISKTLQLFGFKLGNQAVGEILAEDWYKGRTERLLKYCHTAEAFQDYPFMIFGLIKLLDEEFPKSKFILTTRNNSEQWYNSLVRFHTKLFSSDLNRLPNELDLEKAEYRYLGFILDTTRAFWDYPTVPLYSKVEYIEKYENYNDQIRTYFSERPTDFIEINVANELDFERLSLFLNVKTSMKSFPWLNKT